jgi:hypothetical protein
VTRAPFIDITMLRIDIWGGAVGDATEHDRVRARRVIEYVRHRVPAVRDDDARTDPDDEAPAERVATFRRWRDAGTPP